MLANIRSAAANLSGLPIVECQPTPCPVSPAPEGSGLDGDSHRRPARPGAGGEGEGHGACRQAAGPGSPRQPPIPSHQDRQPATSPLNFDRAHRRLGESACADGAGEGRLPEGPTMLSAPFGDGRIPSASLDDAQPGALRVRGSTKIFPGPAMGRSSSRTLRSKISASPTLRSGLIPPRRRLRTVRIARPHGAVPHNTERRLP